MSELIKAGIINTVTGEIIETISGKESAKDMRLRCRDELNSSVNDRTYMTFEFNRVNAIDLNFIRKYMTSPEKLLPVELMAKKYYLSEAEGKLAPMKILIDKSKESFEACLAATPSDSPAYVVAKDAFDEEMEEMDGCLSNLRTRIAGLKTDVKRIEEKLK